MAAWRAQPRWLWSDIMLVHGLVAESFAAVGANKANKLERSALPFFDADPVDVIIIGAGAAGLAAARELARARLSVLVLEARDRIGGRCWSRHEPGLQIPIEFGAEFIHGRPLATFSLLRQASVRALGRTGSRWFVHQGGLQPSDRAELLGEVRDAMLATRRPSHDVSFQAYLDHCLAKRLSAEAIRMAKRMVEGYDAADPRRASARAIVDEWTGESTGTDAASRPQGGYGGLLAWLAAGLRESTVRLRLQSVVRSVRWSRGTVQIEGERLGQPFSVLARRAIVTLPLGVLQLPSTASGAVRFVPPLQAKRAPLASLTSGPALKVILRFRSAFWERMQHGRYRDAGFFQAPGAPFPTFWTSHPLRAPVLIAWAGGPRAQRLSRLDDDAIIQCALSSLKRLFSGATEIDAQFEVAYVHNWQRDPFACGAYSYVKVGGAGARKALAATLDDTLYFAGEAADYEGETGTVAGALQSGLRAARELRQCVGRQADARKPNSG